jgi:chromosome segregation ATPase
MADNTDIAFDLQVKGVEQSIKSVKDLKSAITALQNEAESSDIGSEQYKNAIEQLELLNDKLKSVSQTEKQTAKATEDLAKAEKEATKETQDLRKQFEVLEDELFLLAGQGKQNSKQFKDLTIEAAKLNKKIDEVNSSLGGNETERAAMGYGKLKEGLMNLDFKSVKEGLTGIKTALAATGVMIIVMAVSYLYENFEELSKGSGLLAKALQFVGNIITQVTDGINWLTDSIGITNTALDDMGEATVKNAEKSTEALKTQTNEYDRQIAAAKAAGKSTVDLEIAKQAAIIETNKALVQQTIAYVQQGGVLNEEQKKLLTGQLEAIKTAVTTQQVVTLTAEKEKNEKLKVVRDAENAIRLAESDAFWNKELANIAADQAAKDAARFAEEQAQLDLEARQIAQDEAMIAGTQARNDAARQDKADKDKAAADKAAADEKMWRDNSLQAAGELTTSLSSLSDSYFYFKRKNLEKGSAEDLRQAKKQFNINKGLAIASATISGIQGVVNALSAQSIIPEPFGTALKAVTAVAVGVAAVANIAKISSSKFNEGGGGGAGGGVSPTMPSIPAPPTISTPENNTNKTTSFDETGKNLNAPTTVTPTIKVTATVGVDEISAKKDRVDVLENQSTFK